MSEEPADYKVQLKVSAYADRTHQSEIAVYGAAVKFVAYWLQKQNGVMDMDTEALFDEFKQNVCTAMMGPTGGTG